MTLRVFFFAIVVLSLSSQSVQGRKDTIAFSPFSEALGFLQKQIGYDFESIGFLRRAMTHPSFSGENNKALSILGMNVIDTSISLRILEQNIEITAKDLNHQLIKISEVNSCTADGLRLGLQKIVRVSAKTNSTAPAVVCGAFRAIFGAIAVDSKNADTAGNLFWFVHGDVGRAFSR